MSKNLNFGSFAKTSVAATALPKDPTYDASATREPPVVKSTGVAEEVSLIAERAAAEAAIVEEVAQTEEHLDIPQKLVYPLRDDEVAQSGVDAHPSAKHASFPRAKKPTVTVKTVLSGQAKAGSRSRKSAHIAPDGSGEVRVAVMLPGTMAEWIHRQSFDRGMGVRGKSAIVRECVDGWLADLDAMPAAARKETLRSLKAANATEGELKCYMFGLSSQSLARLDEYASDWSLRLPVAVMMRVSVDRRMRGSASTA